MRSTLRLPLPDAVVRVSLGLLLGLAAFLKLAEILRETTSGMELVLSPWLVLAEGEYLLALWLLSGFAKRWSWAAALLTFGGFAIASLYFGLSGVPTCRCFGPYSLSPWASLLLDAAGIVALLTWPPIKRREQPVIDEQSCRSGLATRTAPAIALALLLVSSPPTGAADETPKVDMEQVASAIEHNYSLIKSFTATTVSVFDRTWIKELGQRALDDELLKSTPARSQSVRKFTVRGDDIRIEMFYDDGTIKAEWVCRDNVFTYHDPVAGRAWIRPRNQMPAGEFLDPREIGLRFNDRRYTAVVREDMLQSAEVVDADNSSRLRVRTKPREGRRTMEMLHEFDPARNYLPTLIAQLFPDGSMNVVTVLQYREVVPGKCWFPEAAQTKIFARSVARSADTSGWREMQTVEIKDLAIDVEMKDASFSSELPPGTVVQDSVEKRIIQVGAGKDSEGSRASFWPLLVVNVGVLCLFVLLYWLHRSRKRKKAAAG